jgi:acyl-CoA thioester hydrolase
MPWRETQRSFVNTWECDENAHLNIQFYVSRFSDAAAHLFAMAACPARGPDAPRLLCRHVRYHHELRVAALTQVSSARVDITLPEGADMAVLHRLEEPSRSFLAATAIDFYAVKRPNGLDALSAVALPGEASPRSLPLLLDAERRSAATLKELGYFEIDRTVLRPGDAGQDGTWTPLGIVSRVSDGMGFAYELIGLTREVVDDAGCGRVTIEMRICPLGPASVGAPLVSLAGLIDVARSTFTVRDVIFDGLSGKAVAVVGSTALLMDLATRKAVPFDPAIRERMLRAIVRE